MTLRGIYGISAPTIRGNAAMTTESRAPEADLSGSTNDSQPCDLLIVGGRVLNLATEAGVYGHAAIAIRAAERVNDFATP